MKGTKYTRAALEPHVRAAASMADLLRRLGLLPTGGNYRNIASRIRYAGLDTSHFRSRMVSSKIASLSASELSPLVTTATSIAQVLRVLALPEEGRPHRDLVARLQELAIDTSHFTGQAYLRGQTLATSATVRRVAQRNRRPDIEVFVENSLETRGKSLARRLIQHGTPYHCAICELVDWQGRPLVLHVDHINGIPNDNRVENLRLLCPNCHSQTPTYCMRMSARPSIAREPNPAACYTTSMRAWRNGSRVGLRSP